MKNIRTMCTKSLDAILSLIFSICYAFCRWYCRDENDDPWFEIK